MSAVFPASILMSLFLLTDYSNKQYVEYLLRAHFAQLDQTVNKYLITVPMMQYLTLFADKLY